MRTSSSIQTLCRSINTSLFSSKSKTTHFLSIPTNGFLFPITKLSKAWCHSLSNSDKLHSPTTTFPEKLDESVITTTTSSVTEMPKASVLKQRASDLGIDYDDSCVPGCFYNLLCPKCKGGESMERSLSFYIALSGDIAMWRCFNFECGWSGRVNAVVRTKRKIRPAETLTEDTLGLMPLGDELIAYFRERMISEETLQRNRVMQVFDDKPAIAFTYHRQGHLVSCKYRTVEKRFWRLKDTEQILYGLDDIVDADEIIIVEGELDKLSVEEAGFRNCVSVPNGAPSRVSEIIPPPEMDIKFEYLWNCERCLNKPSRIILATDGDKPGQVLAEELARRLGKDRCWQVSWPKKDECTHFKDANEVLRSMGPSALKNIIESAQLYSQPSTIVYEQA